MAYTPFPITPGAGSGGGGGGGGAVDSVNGRRDFLVPPTVVSPSTVSASATVPAPTVSADNGGVVVKMWNGSTWVTVTPVVM